MAMIDPAGGRAIAPLDGRAQPRRLLRGELARDRDRQLYLEVCRGRSVISVARMFRISRQLAHRRIKAMPPIVKEALRRQAEAEARERRRIVRELP